MMLPTFTSQQRHALYKAVLTDLSGITQLSEALEREDYESAYRLARHYSDDLLLILNDLGFGELRRSRQFKSPRDVITRVLTRLAQRAAEEQRSEANYWDQAHQYEEETEVLGATCHQMLDEMRLGAHELSTLDHESPERAHE